jgi:hypothetical protein
MAGYRCKCLECEEVGVTSWYEGETGRTSYLRHKDHAKAVQKRKVKDSALAKHMQIQHDGMIGRFSMEVTGTFETCVPRLADEGMRVREVAGKVDILMNSRSEFHQPPIVRMVAVRGNINEEQQGLQGARTYQGSQARDVRREGRTRGI